MRSLRVNNSQLLADFHGGDDSRIVLQKNMRDGFDFVSLP